MRLLSLALALFFSATPCLGAVRVKDVTFPQGVRDYQLIGYGVVVGLQGTGDSLRNAPFTEQSTASMLDRLGVNVRGAAMRTRNLAAVMVTSTLPPFANAGSTIDVTVSSMGDATSLMGGTLLLTPLAAVDGATYALAQGPIAVSGFSASGQTETLTHGVATAGRIPAGATIERDPPRPVLPGGAMTLELRNPDYETAITIVDAVNRYTRKRYRFDAAHERDNRNIALTPPASVTPTRFLAEIGELRIEPATPARIVVDERTGTVVISKDVQISAVAVTHGGLTLRVSETPIVSQPEPFSSGKTVVTTQSSVSASESAGQVARLEGTTLRALVRGLNDIGLKPTGVISILQAVKSAGALQADLIIQ